MHQRPTKYEQVDTRNTIPHLLYAARTSVPPVIVLCSPHINHSGQNAVCWRLLELKLRICRGNVERLVKQLVLSFHLEEFEESNYSSFAAHYVRLSNPKADRLIDGSCTEPIILKAIPMQHECNAQQNAVRI